MQPLSPRGQLVIRYADALIRDRNAYFDELAVWKYRVQSTMLIASATVLVLSVSLNSATPGNQSGTIDHLDYSCWLNIATVVMNGICLLALLFALYQNIRTSKMAIDKIREQEALVKAIGRVSLDDAVVIDDEVSKTLAVEKSRFFAACEIIAYVSFGLLIVCLLVFPYFKKN